MKVSLRSLLTNCGWTTFAFIAIVTLASACGDDSTEDPVIKFTKTTSGDSGSGDGTDGVSGFVSDDATDGTDSTDSTDTTDGIDSADGTDSTDATNGTDATDDSLGDCTIVQEVSCGQTVEAQTTDANKQIGAYGCGFKGQDYSQAPEVSFLFKSSFTTTATFQLEGDSTVDESMEVFVSPRDPSGACDLSKCEYGEDAVDVFVEKNNDYVITVDNWLGLPGQFALKINCCEPDCAEKQCGDDGCGGE